MYVRRDEQGKIELSTTNPYEDENGSADEVISEDDPELLEFLNPTPAEPA